MASPWDFSAAGTYGGFPSLQPTATAIPDHPPGSPEPVARTLPRPTGPARNPTVALVGLLGLAVALISWLNRS